MALKISLIKIFLKTNTLSMMRKLFFLSLLSFTFFIYSSNNNSNFLTKFKNFWGENIKIKLKSYDVWGDSYTKSSRKLRLFFDKEWKDFSFYFDFEYTNSKEKIAVRKKSTKYNKKTGYSFTDIEKIDKIYKKNNFEPGDIYIENNSSNFMSFSLGYKVLSWGQCYIFSPIEYATLPIRFGSTASLDKSDTRTSQFVFDWKIFLTDKTELIFYYIPNINVDKSVEEDFEKELINDEIELVPDINNPTRKNVIINELETNVKIPTGSGVAQKVVRLILKRNWGTLGFTYFKGPALNEHKEKAKLGRYEEVSNFGGTTYYHYKFDNKRVFPNQEVYAMEFVKPLNDSFTLKGEVLKRNAIELLTPTKGSLSLTSIGPNKSFDYANWIINENNSNLWYNTKQIFGGIGIDVKMKNYIYNLYFYYLKIDRKEGHKGRILENEAFKSTEQEPKRFTEGGFATLHIGKYLNKETDSIIGLLAGVLGSGKGYGIYYSRKIRDNIRINFSANSIETFENHEENTTLERISPEKDVNNNFSFNFEYSF